MPDFGFMVNTSDVMLLQI